MNNEKRHCLNCMFSREVDLIGPLGRHVIGQKVHTCQWGPPTPVLVPVAGPANQGALTLTPVFCPVNNQISCGQHRFKNEQPQIGNVERLQLHKELDS